MKSRSSQLFIALALLGLSTINSQISIARAQGTAFTYQGELNQGGNAVNGSYDMRFSLFNASSGGIQIGPALTILAVGVTNGLFSTTVDFGQGVFTATNLWLDTSVGTNGSGTLAELAPRQALTPTPYAITAENVTGVVPLAQLPATVALLNDPGTENFFAGLQAGNSALSGAFNTGVGGGALSGETSGYFNTAVGTAALNVNTSGNNNTANGYMALSGNTGSSGNTANGSQALQNNNGNYNTANGYLALRSNTGGNNNTANGVNALSANTTASDNVAVGYAAMLNNLVGSNSVAVGFEALLNNTNGNKNTASGYSALYGNTSGVDNTANGYAALYKNTVGGYNTAVGDDALYANTNGAENTAVGFQALMDNTAGSNNVASGYQALYNNTISDGNVAVGYQALENGLNANQGVANGYSVAVGYQALQNSTSDSGAVAIGAYALQTDTAYNEFSLISGFCDNTAIGYNSLSVNSGLDNTAVGAWTLGSYAENKGSGNTAVGSWALNGYYGNVTGSNNIALGYLAGQAISAGNNNIHIGNEGTSGDNNTIRIGTPGTQTTTCIAGIWGGTLPGSQGVPIYVDAGGHLGTVTSSARFKEDIKSMADSSEALYSLRPVTFKYRPAIDPKGAPQYGLVAEEVDRVDPDLMVRDNKNQIYSVRYDAVNAMLLNEFLKEHRTVETQETAIQELKQQNNSLTERLNELQAAVKALGERK
jgi:hypothetical protein